MRPFRFERQQSGLLHNSEQAARLWQNALYRARQQSLQKNPDQAACFYRHALLAARSLLQTDNDSHASVNRYVRIAMELIFTERQRQQPGQAQHIYSTVLCHIAPLLTSEQLRQWQQPLKDVTSGELHQVQRWLETVQAMEEAGQHVRH